MLALVVLLALGFAPGAPPSPAAAQVSASPAVEAPLVAVDETQPVEVPSPSDQALQYYSSGNLLWLFDQAWSFLLLAVLLATGFSARLRTWSQRIGGRWFFGLAIYFVLFNVLTSVADAPRAYYEDFVRQHAYGLSSQTFAKWATDWLTALVVSCIIGPLVIWVPYLLLKKSPTRWWLYSGLALVPFIIAGSLIAPIWIAPLFNKFEPMQDTALEAKILALADRAGIAGSRVFEVNKSVDTNTLNAYVAGVFGTKRIVLWDTTIKRMNEPELLFVMGHEMGHFALGHVWQGIALSSVVIVLAFYAAYRTAGSVISRFGDRFGFSSLDDIASLPLLLTLVAAFSLITTPAQLAFTRHIEHEADRFGLEITQTNHSAGTAFVKLQTDALAVPRPGLLFTLWRASHPPLGERIDYSNDYHPWREGLPLVYGTLFH